MKKKPWFMLLVLFSVFGALWIGLIMGSGFSLSDGRRFKITRKPMILKLELNGIIVDGKKLLKPLRKYREQNNIRAVVVEVNSPGGVVGPSQEIYEEIRRIKEELDKPVVAVSTGLMASGAYYAALGADKIVVQPGTLVGSIGVIMQFTNLEKLYEWAKISRFAITTGKYKDSGAEYRPMREDERQVFQSLMNDVWQQFMEAVVKGRNLPEEKVREYSDGRVFTGREAKEFGLVDELGTVADAYDMAARLAGFDPDEVEVFEPPKYSPFWWQAFLESEEGEQTTSWDGRFSLNGAVDRVFEKVFKTHLANRPLYLMPGAY